MNAGDREIIWVAKKIIRKFKISRKGMAVRFDVDENEKDAPSYSDQIDVIDKLKMFGIIKATRKNVDKGFDVASKNGRVDIVRIEILQPYFDNFLEEKYGVNNEKGNYIFPDNYSEDKTSKERTFFSLLNRSSMGDYFYNGIKVEVPKSAEYFKAFDVLFTHCDQDGFLSYEDIEKGLVELGISKTEDRDSMIKRINNYILNKNQGFFRYAKVNGKKLKNKLPDGRLLVDKIRGKGLILNNPTI